ncbi:uncharacterized protein BJ171DRAFT_15118 [Polychytrium aggregatum]|uniref:uncharacterized protein n=1 Tax=Polychytrium aggregatum TaxID=110093 RepID=UPI0022FF3CC3|nr:uncharacterized protein BJ171DRAFT_15118 [Polychytrium aggregatum]KAI9206587.1 hypothetical protein BJ171DRAFT_15118 [Polychytrium aggregatum]
MDYGGSDPVVLLPASPASASSDALLPPAGKVRSTKQILAESTLFKKEKDPVVVPVPEQHVRQTIRALQVGSSAPTQRTQRTQSRTRIKSETPVEEAVHASDPALPDTTVSEDASASAPDAEAPVTNPGTMTPSRKAALRARKVSTRLGGSRLAYEFVPNPDAPYNAPADVSPSDALTSSQESVVSTPKRSIRKRATIDPLSFPPAEPAAEAKADTSTSLTPARRSRRTPSRASLIARGASTSPPEAEAPEAPAPAPPVADKPRRKSASAKTSSAKTAISTKTSAAIRATAATRASLAAKEASSSVPVVIVRTPPPVLAVSTTPSEPSPKVASPADSEINRPTASSQSSPQESHDAPVAPSTSQSEIDTLSDVAQTPSRKSLFDFSFVSPRFFTPRSPVSPSSESPWTQSRIETVPPLQEDDDLGESQPPAATSPLAAASAYRREHRTPNQTSAHSLARTTPSSCSLTEPQRPQSPDSIYLDADLPSPVAAPTSSIRPLSSIFGKFARYTEGSKAASDPRSPAPVVGKKRERQEVTPQVHRIAPSPLSSQDDSASNGTHGSDPFANLASRPIAQPRRFNRAALANGSLYPKLPSQNTLGLQTQLEVEIEPASASKRVKYDDQANTTQVPISAPSRPASQRQVDLVRKDGSRLPVRIRGTPQRSLIRNPIILTTSIFRSWFGQPKTEPDDNEDDEEDEDEDEDEGEDGSEEDEDADDDEDQPSDNGEESVYDEEIALEADEGFGDHDDVGEDDGNGEDEIEDDPMDEDEDGNGDGDGDEDEDEYRPQYLPGQPGWLTSIYNRVARSLNYH